MSAMAPAYAALGQHERALKMNTSALLIAQAQLDSDSVEIIKYLLHVADRLHSIGPPTNPPPASRLAWNEPGLKVGFDSKLVFHSLIS